MGVGAEKWSSEFWRRECGMARDFNQYLQVGLVCKTAIGKILAFVVVKTARDLVARSIDRNRQCVKTQSQSDLRASIQRAVCGRCSVEDRVESTRRE